MNTCLVIPTIREHCARDFFREWHGRGGWDEVILVEDAEVPSFDAAGLSDRPLRHFTHTDVQQALGDESWIISRRNSACRVFGFLAAWWGGFDAVLTIDDDCFPVEGCNDFVASHAQTMAGHRRWVESVPGQRMRGLPYRNLGSLDDVKVNVGLWTTNPDVDAPCALVNGPCDKFTPPAGSRLLPAGQYAPLCGMNVCALREALPLLYQPPMGQGQPFDRFEDIWGGLLLKRIADHLGWHVAIGEPFVEHRRASDPFRNLVKEAAGIGENEHVWERIAWLDLTEKDATRCMGEAGDRLRKFVEGTSPLDRYLATWGKALQVWAKWLQMRPVGI